MTMQQAVLSKILNCGYCDLELLEDIDYDLDNIIEDLMDNNCLSLHGIFRSVFTQGALDLQAAFNKNKDTIREEILQSIEEDKNEWVNSGEMTQAEFEECDEYKEKIRHLKLLDDNILRPEKDVGMFLNYQDTHVSIKHLDFYKAWMETTINEIESNMGWDFEEGFC